MKNGVLNKTFTGLSFIGRDRPPTSEELAEKQRDYILRTIDFSESEKIALFHDTAAKAYRIEPARA